MNYPLSSTWRKTKLKSGLEALKCECAHAPPAPVVFEVFPHVKNRGMCLGFILVGPEGLEPPTRGL
jgi:hypothetical protein